MFGKGKFSCKKKKNIVISKWALMFYFSDSVLMQWKPFPFFIHRLALSNQTTWNRVIFSVVSRFLAKQIMWILLPTLCILSFISLLPANSVTVPWLSNNMSADHEDVHVPVKKTKPKQTKVVMFWCAEIAYRGLLIHHSDHSQVSFMSEQLHPLDSNKRTN